MVLQKVKNSSTVQKVGVFKKMTTHKNAKKSGVLPFLKNLLSELIFGPKIGHKRPLGIIFTPKMTVFSHFSPLFMVFFHFFSTFHDTPYPTSWVPFCWEASPKNKKFELFPTRTPTVHG